MRSHARSVLLATALSLAACGDKPPPKAADDDLTIVVQADRSRIESEESTLAEQRKALAEERERLRQEIEKLNEAPGRPGGDAQAAELLQRAIKLVRDQEDVSKKRDELARQWEGLVQKVVSEPGTTIPAVAAPAPDGTARLTREVAAREKDIAGREKAIADREKSVADRERELASREAALAQRDSACAAAPGARRNAGEELTRAEVERAYKGMLSAMDAKGVLVNDLPPSRQKAIQDASARTGDLAKAMSAIDAVQATLSSIAIDGEFVAQKVKRVSALQRKQSPDAKTREEVARMLQEVTRSYSDGRYLEANRALNNIVQLIERPGGDARRGVP